MSTKNIFEITQRIKTIRDKYLRKSIDIQIPHNNRKRPYQTLDVNFIDSAGRTRIVVEFLVNPGPDGTQFVLTTYDAQGKEGCNLTVEDVD